MDQKNFDVIIVGAGHNGLTAAALLSRRGKKVLVLEKRDHVGGLCIKEEFHPGYFSPGLLHDTSLVNRSVVESLGLERWGLSFEEDSTQYFIPSKSGSGVVIEKDQVRATGGADLGNDLNRYREYLDFHRRLRPFVQKLMEDQAPLIDPKGMDGYLDLATKALALRKLGKRDMLEFLRAAPMCSADWLNDWFETSILKVGMVGPAVFGSFTGPWSPCNAVNLIFHQSLQQSRVRGGAPALIAALEKEAVENGVEIRKGETVCEILVSTDDDPRATGVKTQAGEEILAPVIMSSCDPRQLFLKQVPSSSIPFRFVEQIQHYRMRGTTAKVHLALNQALSFKGHPGFEPEWIRLGCETLDEVEQAFDSVKYREFSQKPLLELFVPSINSSEYAPAGHHVVSILVHFAPYDLEGGWNEQKRKELGDRAIENLSQYVEGLKNTIVATEVLTPQDIESRFGVSGGHIYHGEHSIDQIFTRPTPDCARYETPLNGLYICGSGAHPGGGVTCTPGALAAGRIR